jgi:hypothetical protein
MKKFYSSPPVVGKKMEPSRCFTRAFSSIKRIFRASQT